MSKTRHRLLQTISGAEVTRRLKVVRRPRPGTKAMSKTAREVIADCLYELTDKKTGEAAIDYIFAALVAAGFVIVPKVPTPAMLKAANDIMGGGFQNSRSDHEIYEAMIEVAQKPKPTE